MNSNTAENESEEQSAENSIAPTSPYLRQDNLSRYYFHRHLLPTPISSFNIRSSSVLRTNNIFNDTNNTTRVLLINYNVTQLFRPRHENNRTSLADRIRTLPGRILSNPMHRRPSFTARTTIEHTNEFAERTTPHITRQRENVFQQTNENDSPDFNINQELRQRHIRYFAELIFDMMSLILLNDEPEPPKEPVKIKNRKCRPIDPDHICPITQEAIGEYVMCVSCKNCINAQAAVKWLTENPTCPMCRTSWDVTNITSYYTLSIADIDV